MCNKVRLIEITSSQFSSQNWNLNLDLIVSRAHFAPHVGF